MEIKLINPFNESEKLNITNEGLCNQNGSIIFPCLNGAYRVLVQESNYTENFGFQWNKFVKTQIDSASISLSEDRFFAQTGWEKGSLEGQTILEVGSGAGRFTDVILKHTKATLYSVDYSNAVEANFTNNQHYGLDRFKLFQASIYEMPFEKNQFDKVVCFGVLQHTPSFKKSIEVLISMVKPGGELVVDFYAIKGIHTKIQAKYMLRPFLKKLDHEKLLKKIDNNVDWMIKCSSILNKLKLKFLNRFIPIVDIYGTLPHETLSKAELREWCVLDTFDMFSPEYDQPERVSTVVKWFKNNGMENVKGGYIKYGTVYSSPVVSGIKGSTSA